MPLSASWTAIDREALLHVVVSGGGAALLVYALFARATDRATPRQVRGLTRAGVGFLLSAGASMYLRDHLVLGAAVSLGGALLAMAGMLALVRGRAEGRLEAERRRLRGR
jgi:hypothetical protein